MPIVSPKIPQGLEELMKGLAKSVIKENPDNIYEFAAEYFENLLRERDGTVDQNYKKFATYKVYKKSRMERRKREKENLSNIDDGNLKLKHVSSINDKVSSVEDNNSIEKIALSDSVQTPLAASHNIMVSSESEIKTTIKEESFVDDEGTPQQKSVNSDDENINSIVLDDEMANAALKIQSTFRGHRVRKEMKENDNNDLENDMTTHDDIEDIIDGPNVRGNDNLTDEIIAIDGDSNNEIILDATNSNLENVESFSHDEENQLMDTEADENIDKENINLEEEVDEINLVNCSSEANEKNFNDAGELGNEDVNSEAEQDEKSAETNIQQNLQPENVILMEVESNAVNVITSESSQNSDNVEAAPKDGEKNKSYDASGDVQVELIEKQNLGISVENSNGTADVDVEHENDSAIDTSCEGLIENIENEKDTFVKAENIIENPGMDIHSQEKEKDKSLENLNSVEITYERKNSDDIEAKDDKVESTELNETNSIEKISDVQSIDEGFKAELPEAQSIENYENENDLKAGSIEMLESSINSQDKGSELDNSDEMEVSCQDKGIDESIIKSQEEGIVENENCNENQNFKDSNEISTDTAINQRQPSGENTDVLIDNKHDSIEHETLNIENNEEHENEKIALEEMLPCDVNYEKLCESTESQDKIESNETTNENSIDADSKSIDSKISSVSDTQGEEKLFEPDIKLENILSENISPYDLVDEVVNQEAAVMAQEILPQNDAVNNEEDDIANMVLDEEMEGAALKIQSTFRGHKTRNEIKSKQQDTETTEEIVDDDIANMVLDEEMEGAALKIQSTFRGHKTRNEIKSKQQDTETTEEIVDDDIANMVLDEEMEQAALKIQSSFRGHKVRMEYKNIDDKKDDDVIKSIESSLDEKNAIESITKPELLDLSVDDKINDGDEINDEILNPDKEDSEIPEENSIPLDNVPFTEQKSCSEDDTHEISPMLSEPQNEEKDSEKDTENPSKGDENVEDMILDEEMEDAALKIQAAFRGHQVRKDNCTNDTEDSKQEENSNNETIIIEQCSEGNEDTQENEETQENDEGEQQDTSADVDEIQESEAAEEVEETEEANEDETTETETNEQGGDDPEEPEQAEGESSTQQETNDDDDVANMVLDEEMEVAALKIQSTFRGHKTRTEMKTKQEVAKEDSTQEVEDDIANMVLDDEMEQAALKIQSVFRGKSSKKEDTENKESEEEEKEKEKDESEEEKKEEEEKNEPTTSEGSSEKSAQQQQEEEDIANLVMDDEMEKTALKIQCAFRGKIKRKSPKDSTESNESEDYNADIEKSDENPSDMFEYFGMSVECDENDYSEYLVKRESYADGGSYSIERDNAMSAYNETIYPSEYETDVDLMHGGGIFPETSGESGTLDSTADYMSEDNNNDPPEDKKEIYKRLSTSSAKEEVEDEINESEEKKVIESFDFESNKDTAEAMYYSLKKNEIEAQKIFESTDMRTSQDLDNYKAIDIDEKEEEDESSDMETEENDDDDVVVSPLAKDAQKLKYGMSMDDRLLGSILSQDYSKGRRLYPDEMFDPLLEEAMSSNYNIMDKLREISKSDEDVKIEDNNVGDEDQFEDFYPGNIRSKIMASSISIADSDYFDPTNNKSIIDDDRIRTALETIHSTDSESTIGSAATKIQATDKNLTAHRNKHFQYSSIGNAAIDKSLDEFIQSQELRIDRFEEEPEGYYSPPPKKQESADDFTDDTCTESERRPTMAGIIEIKLEQKHFLTVDERRRTLHREDAIQRNSTRSVDEDTSKSSNISNDKFIDKNNTQSDAMVTVKPIQGQSSIIDTEIAVPVLEKPKSNVNMKAAKVSIRRQKTMPVQIESNVIRVLPKHLRKRIKSADSDKKKRIQKQ